MAKDGLSLAWNIILRSRERRIAEWHIWIVIYAWDHVHGKWRPICETDDDLFVLVTDVITGSKDYGDPEGIQHEAMLVGNWITPWIPFGWLCYGCRSQIVLFCRSLLVSCFWLNCRLRRAKTAADGLVEMPMELIEFRYEWCCVFCWSFVIWPSLIDTWEGSSAVFEVGVNGSTGMTQAPGMIEDDLKHTVDMLSASQWRIVNIHALEWRAGCPCVGTVELVVVTTREANSGCWRWQQWRSRGFVCRVMISAVIRNGDESPICNAVGDDVGMLECI